ncbi:MAG TPA: hypothetical protein VFY93_17520 [Planctomycetota bacterium]|nr:hypothetical protein [Planctomycetota bacterium]
MPAEAQMAAVEAAAAVLAEDLPAPDELMEALQRSPDGDKAQILLIGMVANAASRGPAALPGIRELLRSGVDLQFPDWDGKGLGYPSLRVALLAAAEATGDPSAAQLVAEVARTSESPVEVVFGAHILDRLQALDAPTAQRALDALGKPLTKEQARAMGGIVDRVVPAAAAADPAYAEQFLMTQLRMPKGQGADPRFAAAVLDGIPARRAQDLVVANLTAADVSDGAKRMLAGRAATRAELSMLTELQHGIEAGIYSKPVAATIAQSAVGNRAYRQIEREARRALKAGDLDKARALATDYHQWITATQQTVEAAQRMGAPLRRELPTYMKLQQQRLFTIRNQIAKALKQQAAAAK